MTAAAIVVAAGAGPSQAAFQTFFGAMQMGGQNVLGAARYADAKSNFLSAINIIGQENFENIATTPGLQTGTRVGTSLGDLEVLGPGSGGARVLATGLGPGGLVGQFSYPEFGNRTYAGRRADFAIHLNTAASAIGWSMRSFYPDQRIMTMEITLSLGGVHVGTFAVAPPSPPSQFTPVSFFGILSDTGTLFDHVRIHQNTGSFDYELWYDSFITGNVIPLPTSVLLAGAGLVVVGMRRRGPLNVPSTRN
jgi:hypothetical protein